MFLDLFGFWTSLAGIDSVVLVAYSRGYSKKIMLDGTTGPPVNVMQFSVVQQKEPKTVMYMEHTLSNTCDRLRLNPIIRLKPALFERGAYSLTNDLNLDWQPLIVYQRTKYAYHLIVFFRLNCQEVDSMNVYDTTLTSNRLTSWK